MPARKVHWPVYRFDGAAIGESPGVGGVVEGSGVDQGPVQEIAARIIRVLIFVENIDHAELADRDHQPVRGLRSRKLVDAGVDFLNVAAEVDGLPEERARHPCVGIGCADLVGLGAQEIRGRPPNVPLKPKP